MSSSWSQCHSPWRDDGRISKQQTLLQEKHFKIWYCHGSMWCWNQIGPPHVTYEVVVSFAVGMTAWAGSFIFTTISYELYSVTSTARRPCGQG